MKYHLITVAFLVATIASYAVTPNFTYRPNRCIYPDARKSGARR